MEVEQQSDADVPAENRVESPRRRRTVGRMKKQNALFAAVPVSSKIINC